MSTDLKAALTERLDAERPPPGNLERARAVGRSIRRRRRLAAGTGVVAAVVAVTTGLSVAGGGDDPRRPDRAVDGGYATLGPISLGDGLRAYADPGREIHMGGRTFSWDDAFGYFDTDAAATPYGIVFYDAGRPMLLGESGEAEPLIDGPVDDVQGFHPTAKFDVQQPLVASATIHDGVATVSVHDMETGEDVAATEVGCGWSDSGPCPVVIDGIDDGVVFVRDPDGTRSWDSATSEWRDFAGPETRVADVRNGVVLHTGPAPTSPGPRRVVKGPIDAQLSHDGEFVLYWSSRLESTTPGRSGVELEQGGDGGPNFWTVDTDGSVLVAAATSYPEFTMYDCELPSGACTQLGPLETTGGDPMFIGNDM